ncbi:MAG: cytochrome P450 [Betaproteobacteria bacterium]|nr:cytochrome P450 [Betaproteobacteria bacterium]NBO44568.1 cytochrome P450 [Betaproteobacteria bacterium]NBP10910.1 cytochrome P450 [Betaproteobacteria bacterium]NBP61510.1 cytochrome P450 [Betaproteobacteria bacterium]NBQ81466.1 cytochrome P450 [Betaproteobacteria bacterium]
MKLQSIDWRPEDPAILANPYPIFSRMRDEDPCYWSDRLRSWVITRYDDVKAMCLDKERLSSDRLRPFFQSLPGSEASRISEIIRYLSLWMVFKDPPEHTRLRKLTAKVFSARAMQAMRPQVETIADQLLDALGERDEFDLIADYAGPLPCLVIMAMLGVPVQALAQLKRLSDEIALFIGSSRMSSDKYDTAEQATQEMAAFFKALIGERRAHPKTDAISELVHLLDGEDRFSDDELVASCILMLFAGHETTTNLIANGVYALIHFPDAYQALRNDPTLAQNAVEELLRYDGPSGSQVRVVCRSFALHGKELQAGQRVFMMLNAANRDPRAYPDPDRLDLSRDGAAHLAFGYGSHICLGFPLARLEGMVAIPALLNRFRSLELLKEPPWINSLVFRGMQQCLLRGVR